jgi:ABC-type oligopeptide transport system substrate-binding subunit
MKKRNLFYLTLAVLAVGAMVFEAHAQQLAKEQIINIAFDAGDLQTLDPHRAATTVDRATVDMVFNGLVLEGFARQEGLDLYPPEGRVFPSLSGKRERLRADL